MKNTKTLFTAFLSTCFILGPAYYEVFANLSASQKALEDIGAQPITTSSIPIYGMLVFGFLMILSVQYVLLKATAGMDSQFMRLGKSIVFFSIPVVQYLLVAYTRVYDNLGYEPGHEPAWPLVLGVVASYALILTMIAVLAKRQSKTI